MGYNKRGVNWRSAHSQFITSSCGEQRDGARREQKWCGVLIVLAKSSIKFGSETTTVYCLIVFFIIIIFY